MKEEKEKPIFDHLMERFPHMFENIDKMDYENIRPKRIFKIIQPFLPIIEDDEDSRNEKIYVLPINYLDYGNLNIHPCEYVGIKFCATNKDPERYEKSINRLRDICSNIYNGEKDCVETDPKMRRMIGTIWEERRNRFFPIVLNEGENLMMNVNISDTKIKELMSHKLKFIDSLKKDALQMKMPEKVGDSGYKFLGNIDREVAYDVAIERQDYTCFGCGYRPENVDKIFRIYEKEDGKILEPHRVVHKCFLGDYHRDNVVILCQECHNLEYKYFKVHWNRFFENGKLMEWNRLIEESFEFFKEWLIWLHLRK